MKFQDYYQVLDVDKSATQGEIKKSYRKLSRKYHPDVSKLPDATEKFKALGEAYEVLKDPEKRAAYDRVGQGQQAGQNFEPPPGWDEGFEFSGQDNGYVDPAAYSDFFESIFGGEGTGRANQRQQQYNQPSGQDHHAKILIDLEDAYTGTVREITLQIPYLDAQGHVKTEHRALKVKIPKGIKQGQKIRLAGQGGVSVGGGLQGNLYLQVEFNTHALYSVEGQDVYLKIPITPWEAALGAKIKIPTPAGVIQIKVPEKSISGSKLRLKGRGIPAKITGDLFVILQVSFPPADTEKAKLFYQNMAKEFDFNPRKNLGVD